MTKNVPLLEWSLLPDTDVSVDRTDAIVFIGKLFSGPAMQALVRLNPNGRISREYYASFNILDVAWKHDSVDVWGRKVDSFHARYPDGMISFGHDCRIVAEILEDIDQLRILWDQQLISSEAFREIFTLMIQANKTHHKNLMLSDAPRFSFDETQMKGMMAMGIAFRWWGSMTLDRVIEVLEDTRSITNID